MSNRSLVNSNSGNSFLGYPVSDTPTDNSALFFVGGEFFFATISESGGIIGVVSLGGGSSIFKNISGGIMNLRSLVSANGNIIVTQLTDIVSFQLSQFLTNLKKITFTNGINLEEATDNLNLNITDGGAAILKLLNFNTSYGGVSSTALTINNQAKIDIYGPTYLNTISDGTPNANKFLALDNTGKIIKSTITDTTTAANTPGTNFKWFMYKTGDTLEFRSFRAGLNLNIGIVDGEYQFSVAQNLNKISQINRNLPRSPGATTEDPDNYDLRIGSKNIYLDNFEIGNTDKFIVIDTAGTLAKGFAVENLLNTPGLGVGIFKNIVSGFGYFKNLIAGDNINLTSNTDNITVATTGNLENIFNINALAVNPATLFIHNDYVNFPNLIDRPWSASKKNIWIDSTDYGYGANSLCTGYSLNTVANVGTNSIIAANTIATNGNLNLKGITGGVGVTITNNATDIIINSASANNIFTSNGQSTDDQRIFNGKTPGSLNNKITFNDVNLGLTNSLVYNSSYQGSVETPNILAFADGGNYSKFINAPYNHQSLRIDVPMANTYGSATVFYESVGVLASGFLEWIFEIEIYEKTAGLPQAFVARYSFVCNAALTPVGAYYIQPSYTSNFNGTSPQNFVGLETYQSLSGPNPVWVLRLVNLGLGLTMTNTTYSVFVKDLGRGDKIVSQNIGSSIVVPESSYLTPYDLAFSSGTGFPPNLLVNYTQPGKDIRINVFAQLKTLNTQQALTFTIRFNGVNVYTLNGINANQPQSFAIISGCRRFKMIDLIKSGALPLSGPFTISYFIVGVGYNMTTPLQPYEIIYEYC